MRVKRLKHILETPVSLEDVFNSAGKVRIREDKVLFTQSELDHDVSFVRQQASNS